MQSLTRLRLSKSGSAIPSAPAPHEETSHAGEFSDHLRAFIEGTTDCVLFLDREWRLTFLNQRAVEELPGGASLIGMKLTEAFSDKESGATFGAFYRRAVKERTPQVFEAYYAPLATWYEVHAIPVDNGLTVIFRNINERRNAAEALRERNRQLATVFGQTMVGILHRDLRQQVLMVNERFCDMVGRSREELNGLPLASFTHPDDVERYRGVVERHRSTGEPFQIELRFIRPGGEHVWCVVNASFVRDDSGVIVSTILVADDVGARKVAEDKLREGQDLLRGVIDSIPDMVFVKDREGRYVLTNKKVNEECGPLEGCRDHDIFPPEVAEGYVANDQRILATGEIIGAEEMTPVRSGARMFHTVKVPWKQDGKIMGVIGVSRDIADRLATEAELRESRRQLTTLIDNLPGLVYRSTLTPPWTFSFISEGAEQLTGYPASEFTEGRLRWVDLVHPDDIPGLSRIVSSAIESRKPFSGSYRIITCTGEKRWVLERGQCIYDADSKPCFLEGFIDDITAQKNAEEHLRWGAHHDSLTRLPNRMLFQERLEQALKRSGRTGRKVALLLLDADHLKEVNDTLGHDAGDVLLRMMASRLSAAVRSTDTVARNGGDEFAVIMPDIEDGQDLEELIQPILRHLLKPFTYAGHTLECRASIGASIWPDHAQEANELLKQADIALYTAKTTGRGKLMVFESAMRAEAHKKAQMRHNAREAIDADRIEPYYQPKVNLASGSLSGFEALLRWHNPITGVEAPGAILAAFDDPHLAIALGRRMHDLVFADMRRWLDAGIDFDHVAINASAVELRGKDFADQVLERLRTYDIPSRCLEIEVTETVFLGRGAEHVETVLRTLSAEGVRIALDDFGTGYASLSHLKQFPVDSIKIDRSFVQDLADNPDDTAILLAVLNLGHNLGIDTIAEGIETSRQAEFLKAQGCNFGQGYFFGRAAPKHHVPGVVTAWDAAKVALQMQKQGSLS